MIIPVLRRRLARHCAPGNLSLRYTLILAFLILTGILLPPASTTTPLWQTHQNESMTLTWARGSYWICENTHGVDYHCPGCNSVELLQLMRLGAIEQAMHPSHPTWCDIECGPSNLYDGKPNASSITVTRVIDMLRSAWPKATLAKVVLPPADVAREADQLNVSNQGSFIPRLIHMSVKDINNIHPKQALMIASWAILNPGHTILIYSDRDVRKVVEKHFPKHLSLLDGLHSPVERTDLWRYLVICGEEEAYGGVYADSDVLAAVPIVDWPNVTVAGPGARLFVGLENLFKTNAEATAKGYARQVQWSQWTIAGYPGHPVTCGMGDAVQRHVDEEVSGKFRGKKWSHDRQVLERTGPGIWSTSVNLYIRGQGMNMKKILFSLWSNPLGVLVNDMLLLPMLSFGCPSENIRSEVWNKTLRKLGNEGYLKVDGEKGGAETEKISLVFHQFMGSWRLSPP